MFVKIIFMHHPASSLKHEATGSVSTFPDLICHGRFPRPTNGMLDHCNPLYPLWQGLSYIQYKLI